jgi:hypothetical protein
MSRLLCTVEQYKSFPSIGVEARQCNVTQSIACMLFMQRQCSLLATLTLSSPGALISCPPVVRMTLMQAFSTALFEAHQPVASTLLYQSCKA